ncbi:PEP-CTERM sorting domain-containing protein [Sphingoaurantiacus capsulatus]|uniref:PEP-CTERM sorting domain-containing protein n=1 Tax=Sphingoaurantiacus capsulatus TaxID=1771310 RepID=A0ABV7XET6_9SPHN
MAAGVLAPAPAVATPVSINLAGTCSTECNTDGTDGNARVYTFLDGLGLSSRVRVTAWSATQNTSTGALSNWQTGFVGQYQGGGLGVTNRNEGDGSSNNGHTMDNSSGIDFLVFHFDGDVVATGADLNAYAMTISGSSGKDTDASFYIGSSTVAFGTSINMANTTQRLSATNRYIDTTGPGSDNYRNFNTTTEYKGNVLIIAASVGDYMRSGGGNRADSFKVQSIKVEYPIPAPEPAAIGLFGLGVLGLGLRRRRRG